MSLTKTMIVITLSSALMCSHAQAKLQKDRVTDLTKKIRNLFRPDFLELNSDLQINISWQERRSNAHATRNEYGIHTVTLNEGLINHRAMNLDALALIVCHEIGHFLGGAPKATRGANRARSWSSAEGQADYFATSKCLKRLFDDETENRKAVQNENSETSLLENSCRGFRCQRIIRASVAAARFFGEIDKVTFPPALDTPDITEVYITLNSHPSAQCRLDTFVAGTLCQQSEDLAFDNHDPSQGACTRAQGEHFGARPRCWYYPAD